MADFIDVPPWVAAAIDYDAAQPPARLVLVPGTIETAHAVPPTPQSQAPAAEQPPAWVMTISTGVVIPVRGFGLIGRDPAPRRGEVVDHSISVGNSEKSVSKTHLAFGLDDGQLWIEDRNSTNGTFVIAALGAATPCEPGRRTIIKAQESVRFGDLSLTIARP